MALNDKILTLATGAFLAIGGATASLFLGDHSEAPSMQSDATMTANLGLPEISSVIRPSRQKIEPGFVMTEAAETPERAEPEAVEQVEQPDLVFASIEPDLKTKPDEAGSDLVEVAIVAGVPELAVPAPIHDIVLTRAVAPSPKTKMPRYAAGIPNQKVDLARTVILPVEPKVSCDLNIRATPIFGARVTLRLAAPCHPNVVATIRHGGLQFKERLDNAGLLKLKVPAFAEYARFDIELSDGTRTTVGAYIAGMSAIERVGIAWTGENDTFLHAFQKGAQVGDDNHIWLLNTHSFATTRVKGGGYMTVLGDETLKDARMAQVYTLPKNKLNAGQYVSLSIETLRGETACDQDLLIKVARHSAVSGGSKSALSLNLPKCGADTPSLLLKNVLKDMKVARK